MFLRLTCFLIYSSNLDSRVTCYVQVKIALVGILAGGTGLNLSAAQNVVFLELPKDPSHFLQVYSSVIAQVMDLPGLNKIRLSMISNHSNLL